MKRIAVMSDAWHRLVGSVTFQALIEAFDSYKEPVVLCQFNCFGNWSHDERYNEGEYNIHMLPDLDQYDGVVLDLNTVIDMAQVEKLIRITKAANVPVITIGFEVEGFYYAGIDNGRPIFDLMDHLYNVHGCRSFVFAGGPFSNSENVLRTKAYKDFLSLYSLNPKENPILIGDFDFMSGCKHFQTIRERHMPLPDAFVCANDNIAAGIIYEAEKYGYKVPEDFRVTGFDNLDKASYYNPQISSVGYSRARVGKSISEILKKIWAGEASPQYNFTNVEYYFTESCGCPSRTDVNFRIYSGDNIISNIQLEINEAHLLDFESKISACTEFNQIFTYAGKFFSHLECEEFMIFVDDRLYKADSEIVFKKEGYDWSHLQLVSAFEPVIKKKFKNSTEVISYLEQSCNNDYFIFTPIHFENYTVGFTVIKNSGFLNEGSYLYDIHSVISKGMQSLFKKKQLENAIENLNDLYIRDAMTGAYNRIAFTEKIIPSLTKYHDMGIACGIAFVDTDNFKQINDVYGHAFGDRVLKIIAASLCEVCPDKGFVCRFGGDEFVIFYPMLANAITIEEYSERVQALLKKEHISISMGLVTTNPSAQKAFDEYILDADHLMYLAKQSKKGNEGAN